MRIFDETKKQYQQILKEELVVALGCTEPIAIAYGAAIARDVLGVQPQRIKVCCSGNIIKNVKGVIVPNSGGLKGVEAAAVLGVIGGNADKSLAVLEDINQAQIEAAHALLKKRYCQVELMENIPGLDILIHLYHEQDHVSVQIKQTHTNVIRIVKNQEILLDRPCDDSDLNASLTDRSCLNIRAIYEFASYADLSAVKPLLEDQIHYNLAIAEEGIKKGYGAQVGPSLLAKASDNFHKAIAYAAAGSDARMSGCTMAVVANSGSGNQGITASVPVIVYAQENNLSHERLLQALAFSNLVTVRLKTGIGRLSAYCGVVCAACGAMSAITYLQNGTMKQIEHTIINTLGSISGMVCDGAKPSCAAKIASALYSGMIAQNLAMCGHVFEPDTGIIQQDIEKTIDAIGVLGRIGMRETDHCILDMMLHPLDGSI